MGATDLELAVYEGSNLYTTVTASCYDFQLTVALPDGSYDADATLLDGHSQPVSGDVCTSCLTDCAAAATAGRC